MRKFHFIIILMAALKFVLPFLLQHPVYELHRDEYLYFAQGLHLDVGYLENPPLIGLLGYISWLMGGSIFWIKFWPCLFGAATLLVTAAMAKEMGGRLYAQVIAALGILFSAYLRVHFLFQPNFLDIFFWSLSAYYLLRYINTSQNKYLYRISIAIALGWWSKYSILFFAAAFVIAVCLTPQRKMLLQKHFWLAALLGIVLIVPNVLWQYFHNWPLVHHMSELRATQLKYIDKSSFIKDQLLMLLPVCFVWIGGFIWLLKNKTYRVIAYLYLAIVVLLMLGSGKGYYALGAYPMLLAAGGVWLQGMGKTKSWVRYAFMVLMMLLSLLTLPLLLPLQPPAQMAASNKKYGIDKAGLTKWEDQQLHPLQQDFADMLGWKEMTRKTERLYDSVQTFSKAHTLVLCSNYGQAGATTYYAQQTGFRKNIISGNGTFLLWTPPLVFDNLIYVTDEMPTADEVFFKHFQKAMVIDSVTNKLAREYGTKIILYQQVDTAGIAIINRYFNKKKQVFLR